MSYEWAPPAQPEPGWFPDPYSSDWYVWWDGERWHPEVRRPTGMNTGLKSRTTAGILGILLGGFGVHSFYLGKTGVGIAQIVVTLATCGVGSLWGLVEGILILTRSPSYSTDAQGRPLID